MINEEILGTDIDYQWALDAEGDISLVKGSDNLSQAIYLRLTCLLDNLSWCYDDYGSKVKTYIGENNLPYSQSKLINEAKNTILKDPRIEKVTVQISDWEPYLIGIKVDAEIDSGKTFEEYYIFSNIPRRDDTVNDPSYLTTYIDTKDEYYAKPGELVTVHCHVMDINHKRVPVGQVECLIGGYLVDIDDNPQYIADSHSQEAGSNTFTFRLPLFIDYGEHRLIFKYKGTYGYNSCTVSTKFHVVDRIPTKIQFEYPRKGYEYYYANDEEHFKDAVTYIRDLNGIPAKHGVVDYYIDTGSVDDYFYLDFPLIYERMVLIEDTCYIYISDLIVHYTTKYMFNVRRMFHANDIIECVGPNGDHIDNLIVAYYYGAYYLISTRYIFGEDKDPNTNIKLEVIG